ncbi:phage late control D family protein [Halomonas urumqiensis]|uniref:Late control protein n=1 Tax=Halomonas urumqiensis TaxID=1684789 RepID=A0A2N7UCY8_9GAMM|nr:hypothetical protein [Halomonas urumqiensis]PMR78303.1 hypothetical protein C1H70_16210 [Halomonas urumqiensis]PTB03450.1 hypothetical protein C6V82_02845 [Halomonas urumqiensis]GHE20366.1 hypothetical protein GCM10017767_08870 [Halomonas urumqiensis]
MSLLNMLDDKFRDPAGCVVKIDGQEIDDLYAALVDVSVLSPRQDSAEATLTLETRRVDNGSWNVQDDARIRPWAPIDIQATFGERQDPVFKGFIRQVKVEFPEQKGSAMVTVTCQDTSLLLDRIERNTRWGDDTPKSDREIVLSILGDNNLNALDTPGEGQGDLVVTQNDTDIKFLKKRAQENAYDLFFRDGKLYCGPMRFDRDAQPTIVVYAGTSTNCVSFSLDDDGHHPDAVVYEVATDEGSETNQQTVEPDLKVLGETHVSQVSGQQGDFAWRLKREGNSNQNQMQHRAQAKANEESLKIRATGELDGSLYGHVLLPGDPVDIDGIGDKYSGTWYVMQVEHRFDANGYLQSFEVARNAYGGGVPVLSNVLAGIL